MLYGALFFFTLEIKAMDKTIVIEKLEETERLLTQLIKIYCIHFSVEEERYYLQELDNFYNRHLKTSLIDLLSYTNVCFHKKETNPLLFVLDIETKYIEYIINRYTNSPVVPLGRALSNCTSLIIFILILEKLLDA